MRQSWWHAAGVGGRSQSEQTPHDAAAPVVPAACHLAGQAAAAAPSASQQSAEACDSIISSLKKQRQKYARAKAPFGEVTWAQRGRQLSAAVRSACALVSGAS